MIADFSYDDYLVKKKKKVIHSQANKQNSMLDPHTSIPDKFSFRPISWAKVPVHSTSY